MLPSGYRMRRRDEFLRTVRRGRRAGCPTLVLHLSHRDDPQAETAVGLTVGRAVGSAVVRNRLRRRLRHLVRERLDMLPQGSLLVVRANREAVIARGDQLAADLDSALERLLRRPSTVRGPK